ncbi:SHOCT domain-containing protein [Kitasatospora sp. NPDC058965]|uniref:SHOCT domain-containing protein n=1 Tax=Kitasatospora sp. NPDC058965 TaxID=3346682 RepID=UPI0036CBECA4
MSDPATAEEAMMMYWDDHGMNGWGTGFMALAMLLFLVLLVVGAVALVRYLGRPAQAGHTAQAGHPGRPGEPGHGPTPEDLLAERLARGEIEPDEYRSRLATLRGSGAPPAAG